MALLRGYLRLQVVVVIAVLLVTGSLAVLTGADESLGLLALFALIVAGFAALAVLLSLP